MSIHSVGSTMARNHTATNDSQRAEKRERILRAAIDVFANKGYFSARMADVAKKASVADGTLYLYFDGKEHLLASIFDDVLSRFINRLEMEIASLDDPVEKVDTMVRLHLGLLARDRPLAHVLQIETRHTQRFMNRLMRGKMAEYLGLIRTIIEEGQSTGAFRKDISAGLMTNFVFGAVDELVSNWLLAREPGDLARFHAPVMELLTRGMVTDDH